MSQGDFPDENKTQRIRLNDDDSKHVETMADENSMLTNGNEPPKVLDVDEFLVYIGEFGRVQILLVCLFCLMIIPSAYHTLIMSFIGNDPGWRCALNNSECNRTGVFLRGDLLYEDNCKMNRTSWEFIHPKEFSIVTEVKF